MAAFESSLQQLSAPLSFRWGQGVVEARRPLQSQGSENPEAKPKKKKPGGARHGLVAVNRAQVGANGPGYWNPPFWASRTRIWLFPPTHMALRQIASRGSSGWWAGVKLGPVWPPTAAGHSLLRLPRCPFH